MGAIRKVYAVMAVAIGVAIAALVAEALLQYAGADARWVGITQYVPLFVVLVFLVCVLVLVALRNQPGVRAQRREMARRQGLTASFYVGSIATLLLLYAATIVATGYFVHDARVARTVSTFAPLAIGLGYTVWYGWYARRSARKYDSQNTDTFS